MGINLGQGLAAFAGGAIDRAKEIDKEVADRVKTLKASKPDELLKSRYKKEYEKFDKEQAILAEVTSAGGPDTEPGQMALGGFGTNTAEYRKQLAADPTLYFEMRDAPTAPKYTPTDYNLNGPNTIQRLWASVTGDDETADKGEIEATAGTTTSFKRGEGIADTPEGKERRDTWRRNIPADDTEKEYQFKWRTHQGYVADAVEKYKDNPNSDEAKQTFKALDAAGKTLIYGKDGKDSQTDWQRKLNLHMLDTPKQADFENEDGFNSAMTKWKHGYNILKLGSSYDTTKSGKEQVVPVFDIEGRQVKVIKTDNDDDMFSGVPGWKQFGHAEQKSSTAKRPTLQKTYNAGGDEVTIEYTGDSADTFENRPGWVQVGGAKAPKNVSVAEKKWAPIQVIVDAITEGRSVTQAQLDAAEFITRMTKDAVPLEYHKVLDTWNASTVQVRDYSDMPIKLGGISVPATTTNINAAAAEYNMTPQEYKKQLYKQVKKTQSKSK